MTHDLIAPDLSGQSLVYEAWRSRLFGRTFIAREDFDLSRIPSELAHVSVLGLEDGGLRFRLAGSGLRHAFGCEARGQCIDDLPSCTGHAEWGEAAVKALVRLAPVAGRSRTMDGGVHYWLRLPMSSDGVTVDQVLCHDRYLPADALADPDRAARAADAAMRLDAVEVYAA
jgi:hypothetical protein